MIYLGLSGNKSHRNILFKIFLFIKYFISYTCNYYLSKESSTTFEHIIIIITINHRIMCIKIQYYLLSRNSAAFVFVVITFTMSIWMRSSELHALLLFSLHWIKTNHVLQIYTSQNIVCFTIQQETDTCNTYTMNKTFHVKDIIAFDVRCNSLFRVWYTSAHNLKRLHTMKHFYTTTLYFILTNSYHKKQTSIHSW